ncbi:hypothetical protein [Parabacteroides sp.]
MKKRVHNQQAALRLVAGLLFVFMVMNTRVANAGPPDNTPEKWEDTQTSSIANANGSDGKSAANAIVIASADELAYFAKQVNAGGKELTVNGVNDQNKIDETSTVRYPGGFWGYYFVLSADIDLDGKMWTPIGKRGGSFRGSFDGKGHLVSGLNVEMTTDNSAYAGLFGYVVNGTIQNLGVSLTAGGGIKVSTTGNEAYAGGIVGYIDNSLGFLRNCYVTGDGTVEATAQTKAHAGGIAGYAHLQGDNTDFTHCYATVDVKAAETGNSNYAHAGGIAGYAASPLSYVYATGEVEITAGGNQYAGGICGSKALGQLSNCLALNPQVKVASGSDCHRVAGNIAIRTPEFSFNYAKPDMKLIIGSQESTLDDYGYTSYNGIPTWQDNLIDNLKQAGDEWEKAWMFPTDGSLPQLKVVELNADGTFKDYAPWPTGTGYTDQNTKTISSVLSGNAPTGMVFAIENADGCDGTADHPIQIANAAELAYFARQVNAGGLMLDCRKGGSISNREDEDKNGFAGYFFALSADIELMGGDWTPIGMDETNCFRGHFDGTGHVVSELKVKIEADSKIYAGLFGCVKNGTIQNLGIVLHYDGIEATSTGGNLHAGGIVGEISGNGGTANCYVTGTGIVKGTAEKSEYFSYDAYVGGIAGYAGTSTADNSTCSLTHCYATVNVEAIASATSYAGGIAGYNATKGTISYTYATGMVTSGGGTYRLAGGICGHTQKPLTNCLALNPAISVTAGSDCHRITGNKIRATTTFNYARPDMTLNGQPVTQTDGTSYDGADTWLDTYKNDLQTAAPDEWGDTYWTWTDDYLPQLKFTNSTQPKLKAEDYLRDKPVAPPTPPVTEPDDDDEPTVYYTVTLPAVEGVTTDPVAGDYEVEAWSSFRFYLTIDTAYSQSEPVVTTSRGDVIAPRSSDGAYLVKYVRSDLEIFIAGIDKNPVANEAILPDATRVWCADGALHICTAAPADVCIYTFAGTLHRAFRSDDGEQRVELAPGSYILRIGNESFKVIL